MAITQQQLLRAGDVALFNTRIIHSGTECLRKIEKVSQYIWIMIQLETKFSMRFARLVADTEGIAHLRVRHPDHNNAILLK